MYPAPFEYVCAASLDEAVRFLNERQEDAKVLAGGQSLIPLLKLRLAAPQVVLDIGRLEGLRGIRERNGRIDIGSLVRHVDLEGSELLACVCPLLPETAAVVGDPQVRNRGTLGGSLAHADPSGDFPAAALALDAKLTAVSIRGSRVIEANDFFVDLMTTALRPDEILTSIEVPKLGTRSGAAYAKMHHPASGFAIVGVASILTLNAKGRVEDARVGITGVATVPYRARAMEESLRGRLPDVRVIAEASSAAVPTEGTEVLSDLHASSEYRREMAAIYARRSLERAAASARKAGAVPK